MLSDKGDLKMYDDNNIITYRRIVIIACWLLSCTNGTRSASAGHSGGVPEEGEKYVTATETRSDRFKENIRHYTAVRSDVRTAV